MSAVGLKHDNQLPPARRRWRRCSVLSPPGGDGAVGRFRGANGFAFMIAAPLVMPDVITGLSLLLLFVALGVYRLALRSRDADHLVGARHVLYRLRGGGDRFAITRTGSFDEEAAMDLGAAAPLKVFVITLPMIMPQ